MKKMIFIFAMAAMARAETVNLSSLDLSKATTGWGVAQTNVSCTKAPMKIAGTVFTNGVGTHASGLMIVKLDGGATRFRSVVGVDDDNGAIGKGSVVFRVVGDGKALFKSGVKRSDEKGDAVDVDVSGVKLLKLIVTDAGDGPSCDHADWADAQFEVAAAKPELVAIPKEEVIILTPPPGPEPRINGPKIYGARPGHPFLYRIPCTGERPVKFSAKNLPDGLSLDADTGIITGTTPAKGAYALTFVAENSKGKAERVFKLVAGDTLSLTPQMGFNDWYAYGGNVTEAQMKQAADTMISSGMADAGYQYVNVDGCWQGTRDAAGNLRGKAGFPDMKGLADYIHAKGLKAGLYTSPGPTDCAGYMGSFKHEAQDAKQFADWGYDFLKYDWCSYAQIVLQPGNRWIVPGMSVAEFQKPYRLMGELLKQQNRDIVFNLCQYGMGDVWKWGKEMGGQSWRTTGDLCEELHRIVDIALKNAELGAYNGPGGWNDPDYLQLGRTSRGMSPTEQYSFMSLWCLLPAPLFYSGDMDHLDAFTVGILCNTELIDVNQDVLGKSARVVMLDDTSFLMIKDLEDGSKAVGFCNRGEIEMDIAAKWSDIGIAGKQSVRDLWRQKDLGDFDVQFIAVVPRHGVAMMKFKPAN